MAATSIQNLLQQVANADINQQGLVAWVGENGQEKLETDLIETVGARGILYFPTTAAMALAGGNDSGYAVSTDSNGGLNIYKFFPVIDDTVTGAVTSSSAGQWRPIFAAPAPVTGPWVANEDDDIVPNTPYLDSAVGIGQDTVSEGLALDIKGGLWEDGKARGVMLPVNATIQINAKTLVDNELMVSSNDKMLLRYDSAAGNTKSAGVYAGVISGSISSAASSYSFIFSGLLQPHSTDYKVLISATNATTAAILAGGYYITKTSTQFNINFIVPVVTGGTFSIDYQISH